MLSYLFSYTKRPLNGAIQDTTETIKYKR